MRKTGWFLPQSGLGPRCGPCQVGEKGWGSILDDGALSALESDKMHTITMTEQLTLGILQCDLVVQGSLNTYWARKASGRQEIKV